MRNRSILLLLAFISSGCARDRDRITPTTSGTNLKTMPRGRMTPQPFPGSSLAGSGGATIDPATATASLPDQTSAAGTGLRAWPKAR